MSPYPSWCRATYAIMALGRHREMVSIAQPQAGRSGVQSGNIPAPAGAVQAVLDLGLLQGRTLRRHRPLGVLVRDRRAGDQLSGWRLLDGAAAAPEPAERADQQGAWQQRTPGLGEHNEPPPSGTPAPGPGTGHKAFGTGSAPPGAGSG